MDIDNKTPAQESGDNLTEYYRTLYNRECEKNDELVAQLEERRSTLRSWTTSWGVSRTVSPGSCPSPCGERCTPVCASATCTGSTGTHRGSPQDPEEAAAEECGEAARAGQFPGCGGGEAAAGDQISQGDHLQHPGAAVQHAGEIPAGDDRLCAGPDL